MRTIYAFIILILLSGCAKEVCSVGDIHITESDIDLRAKVSEIYYPGSGKRYVALSQLIKGYLSLQVLKSLGYRVDDAVIETEAKRIDQNTKAPDVLKKIKNVYGNDRAAYLKTFVKVVYAERMLYNEVLLKSKGTHGDDDKWFREKASKIPVKIYDKALKDELLKNVAWARSLK